MVAFEQFEKTAGLGSGEERNMLDGSETHRQTSGYSQANW